VTDRLRGRGCIVTGSTGIGAAVASALAAEGGSIFVVSRSGEHAQGLAAHLREARPNADATIDWAAADLTDESSVRDAVDAAAAALGRLDGLFSVAGGSGRPFGDGPVDRLTADAFDRTIALNLRTHALVAGAVVRRMLGQEPQAGSRGSIVLVSTVLAAHPVADLFATHAYAAAKGGVIALGTAMAAQYAPASIRVNVLAPGLTATAMSARAAADAASVAFAARKQPLVAGFLDPADVAPTAVFLLSDESRALTGQTIAVDGGWSVTAAGTDERRSDA
jgi:NAD(P)-dependent dehydrogenase (short-subunit alcohol dehydrogenase family)